MFAKEDKRSLAIGAFLGLLVVATWVYALMFVTTDKHQGEVYRIIYLHVPSAFTAFLSATILFGFSIYGLIKKTEGSLRWAKSCAEVGLLFTILTLATGSIWGKPTWGTWWTWDARLTTTFILALLYSGYLMLWSSMSAGSARLKSCSVLGILIFVNIIIVYKSVTWWRTLHQPPSLMRAGGPSMSTEIFVFLTISIVMMLMFGCWMMAQRAKNLALKEILEEASYNQLKS